MRGRKTRLWVSLAMLASLAGVACQEPAAPDGVLATYSGGEVTLAEFDAHVERQAAAQESLATGEGDWRVPILEELALREIVAENAALLDDPLLAQRIREATDNIHLAAMARRLGWEDLSVSEAEVRAFYDGHPEIFVDPEKLRLQHIFIRSEAGSASSAERAQARSRLAVVREQVLGGADFAAMAKQHSDSADGPGGGWMLLKRGAQAVPSFVQAAWALEPDEVSEVIETPAGFHIARLAARIPAVERPFEDVREFATNEALKVARRKVEDDYLAEKGPAYNLEIYPERLGDRDLNDATVLFSLDGENMTAADFLRIVPDEYRSHYYTGYLKYLPGVLQRAALERILLREAKSAGVAEEEAVQAEVAEVTSALRAAAEVDRLLELRGAEIPEAELRDHYEQNKERFETVRTRSISMIRLPVEEGKSLWSLLKEGERLVDEIRAGADFAEIAGRLSHHVSAAAGGRLLNQTDDQLHLRVQARARGNRIVNQLAVGEVSKAFVGEVYDPRKLQYSPTGVYIVRLDEDFPPRQAPYEEAEPLVRANYLRRYYTRMLTELRAEMLSEAEFKIIESNLPALGA